MSQIVLLSSNALGADARRQLAPVFLTEPGPRPISPADGLITVSEQLPQIEGLSEGIPQMQGRCNLCQVRDGGRTRSSPQISLKYFNFVFSSWRTNHLHATQLTF